jgi:4-hydroxyacetophenone monooxygenase
MADDLRINDDTTLREALTLANVPSLLMVLVQLTGERRWLDERYRPEKARGLSDNDTGGLPLEVQDEIRVAAFDAIRGWRGGEPVAIPAPSDGLLVEMMGATMGETVPPQYAPMIAAELGVDRAEGVGATGSAAMAAGRAPTGSEVAVIGAGISGICAGVRLKEAGIPFTIFEKNDDVGGVWLQNRYPGAAVDTPNHLYSFSFAPHDWSRYFAPQEEIRAYLRKVAEDFDLLPHIRFATEVTSARWDESGLSWTLTAVDDQGRELRHDATMVISAVGAFNKPKWPKVTGMDRFKGPTAHTARWPDDLDLTGKRVAVIGTGASAMQVVPAIAESTESLTVFQRSPQWIAPFEKFQQSIPEPVRVLLREVPLYYAWYRTRLAWVFNDRLHASLQKDPSWDHPNRSINEINDRHRRGLTRYIEGELGNRTDLLDKCVPDYPPFGKRMLLDNGWYRTVARDDVELIDESVVEVRADRVVSSSGEEFVVDVLVWATGFDVVNFLAPMEIIGRDGRRLHEQWNGDDARAYLGTAIPGFPNLFCLYGPNTQFGHGGSLITVMERQMDYLMALLTRMAEHDVEVVEVREEVHDEYNERIDRAHENMVWTHQGMDTYYRNSRGRVVVNNPFRMVDFWSFTEDADLSDYHTERAAVRAG